MVMMLFWPKLRWHLVDYFYQIHNNLIHRVVVEYDITLWIVIDLASLLLICNKILMSIRQRKVDFN